jgi:flagellar M-ring protein FliF
VHLVSSSVSGLKPENVTIVDNYGKMLAGFKENPLFGDFTSDQLEYQKKVEEDLEKRIKTMLETALGPDKAIVKVSCALDFKKCEKTEERYDPDNQVVRSEQRLNENSNAGTPNAIGTPGVAANLSGATNVTGNANTATGYQKEDRTVNYEIGKVTSRTIEPVGKPQKMSVAVLVDGSYERTKNEEGEEQIKYSPRSQEEMDKLENLVKRAVNYDPQRGDEVEVVNIPFETANPTKKGEKDMGETPFWSSYGQHVKPFIRYAFIGLFLFLSFFFVVRPLMEWFTSSQPLHSEIVAQLPKTVEELEREYMGGGGSLPYRERALDVIKRDGDFSLQLMKDWLKHK